MTNDNDKNNLRGGFDPASNPAPYSALESKLQSDFASHKANGDTAFLVYFYEESLEPKPLSIPKEKLQKAGLANTMRAILETPTLAIVLDLRGESTFEKQWPYIPGSFHDMKFFIEHNPHLPPQLEMMDRNLPPPELD